MKTTPSAYQAQVLALRKQGLTHRQIAEKLGRTRNSVKCAATTAWRKSQR